MLTSSNSNNHSAVVYRCEHQLISEFCEEWLVLELDWSFHIRKRRIMAKLHKWGIQENLGGQVDSYTSQKQGKGSFA